MADNKKTELIIYKTADGKAKIDVRMQGETLWLTQAQMSELFGRSVSVISRQIKNIFAEGELDEKSNLQNIQILNSDNPSGYVKTTSSVIAGLTRFALRCSASVIAGLTRFALRCSASVIAGLTRFVLRCSASVIAGLTRFVLRCSASVIAGLTRFVLRCSASVIAGLTRNPIYGGTLA